MPGDSLIITRLTDSIRVADSLYNDHLRNGVVPAYADHSDLPVFFKVLAFILVLITAPVLYNWAKDKLARRLAIRSAVAALQYNMARYDEVLNKYNGYYQGLPARLRLKFVERVVVFTTNKTFSCIGLEPDERMTILIGAAAVQISFGLNKFMLDFFDTIYIMQHEYNYGGHQKPFEGHVNSSGIYLSWDNFMKGFENYTDGDNLGIHEMAHALAYVNFMAGANSDQDKGFIRRFYDFSEVARPVFYEMQLGVPTLLNNYAATNYNEFWAVSVETFFEKPVQMKAEMPALYNALCGLLNQDPLLPEKILAHA
jgi:MtfA peptidase